MYHRVYRIWSPETYWYRSWYCGWYTVLVLYRRVCTPRVVYHRVYRPVVAHLGRNHAVRGALSADYHKVHTVWSVQLP